MTTDPPRLCPPPTPPVEPSTRVLPPPVNAAVGPVPPPDPDAPKRIGRPAVGLNENRTAALGTITLWWNEYLGVRNWRDVHPERHDELEAGLLDHIDTAREYGCTWKMIGQAAAGQTAQSILGWYQRRNPTPRRKRTTIAERREARQQRAAADA